MISFFRKIRQKLLTQNRITRYLVYALGEILLVVIGILIALGINNANETRKANRLVENILLDLHGAIRSDTTSFTGQIETLQIALASTELLKKVISGEVDYSSEMDTAFSKIDLIFSSQSDYTIFERLKTTGIELVSEDSLKDEIIHYYGDSKNFVKYSEEVEALANQVFPKYFTAYSFGVSATPADIEELRNANEFKILLDYARDASTILISRTIHRKQLGEAILVRLERYLGTALDKRSDPYLRTMPYDTVLDKSSNRPRF
ncbi:DUF6090 family protein [Algoriphagus namhaensis]|uniref:DUF6090 family protein n=1 Tax=Algoriphagus namhaensis TaxID=915353 RepID=A0ABV8AP17_9BACT